MICYSNMGDKSQDYIYDFNLLASCCCTLMFILMTLMDVWRAWNRKAHWIPGQTLVLSAFTILLLTGSAKSYQNEVEVEALLNTLLGLVICGFMAYLLPGMARSDRWTVWGNLLSLTLTSILLARGRFKVLWGHSDNHKDSGPPPSDIILDYSFFWQVTKGPHRVWFVVSSAIIFLCIAFLILLLSSAVLAGKTIRHTMSHNISRALLCCYKSCGKGRCESPGDHVLKCWIVARVCQPDYVMARSDMTTFAGLLITVCLGILIVDWKLVQFTDYKEKLTQMSKAALVVQFVFVLLVSIVVLIRSLSVIMYYPTLSMRHPKSIPADMKADFHQTSSLTNKSIADVKENLFANLSGQLFRRKRIVDRALEGRVALYPYLIAYHVLLPVGDLLQKFLVSLSHICCFLTEICWFLSESALGLVRRLIMRRTEENVDQLTFSQYAEALSIIKMPGEIAYYLWIANERAFQRTEEHMKRGYEDGRSDSCKELIELIKQKARPTQDEGPPSVAQDVADEKTLSKRSWKLRAVSLIYTMVFFYDGSDSQHHDVTKAIRAYSEAWDFMDLVDSLDEEAKFPSFAADKDFDTIDKIWKKVLKNPTNTEELLKKVKNSFKGINAKESPVERACCIESQEKEGTRNYNMNYRISKAAKQNALESLTAMKSSAEKFHNLQCSLGKIIGECMSPMLDKALVENCNKWAQNGKEDEIYRAAFIAGKAKGVRKRLLNATNDEANE